MKFRNYCLVVIGDTTRLQEEIEKISETKPNILDGKGLVIATFSSAIAPRELDEWFTLNKRNFLIFDLNPETCGFIINKKEIHEALFGFLAHINLDDKSADLIREIQLTSDTKSDRFFVKEVKKNKIIETEITEEVIEKMSKDDREILFNKIIDNGIENMSENDKNTLQFLSKY
jgi:hypothetical protein